MNIVAFDLDVFQTCFGSAASAFENIELANIYCELQRYFEGFYKYFTDLSRPTCALGRNYKTQSIRLGN